MFNFESLNKERKFKFDTAEIKGIYTNSKAMYEKHGADKVFRVHGFYPNTKGIEFTYTASLDDTYLNCPRNLNKDIETILNDRDAIRQINNGELGISFYEYENTIELNSGKKVKKVCHSFRFHTIDPEEYDDTEEDEEL